MALDITNGKKKRAQKVVIYGAEGIGKSTLASKFPDPLFIDLEGGTSQLDVKRIDSIQSWKELGATLGEIFKTNGICKTLVIDTADAAENLAREHYKEDKGMEYEAVPYGVGYAEFAQLVAALISTLDLLIKKGINVVVLAHAQIRKFEQPDELGAYDRWELKLSKKTAPLFKEWADMLLFCNYKANVAVNEKTGKAKASGGKRVIYAQHSASYDAKNRHDLPDMFDMDYEFLKPIFEEVKENGKTDVAR